LHSEGKADEAEAPVSEAGMEPAPAVTILPHQDKATAAAAQPAPATAPAGSGPAAPAPPARVAPGPPGGSGPAAPAPSPPAPVAPGQPSGQAATGQPATGQPGTGQPGTGQPGSDLFTRYTRSLVAERSGRQVSILQAGCTTAGTDLGIAGLRAAGAEIALTLVDDDQPVTRAAVSQDQRMAECVLADLRTVPLPQRSHDIVLCALLLHRIQHAELVLDRLVGTLRPGGLLLLRFADRDSAGGFLDRVLPGVARRMVWRRRQPGQPGPYPAVYERLSSAKGLQAYVPLRGLVIAERQAAGGRAGGLAGPGFFQAAQTVVARLSGGRLTDAHEELLYVLRKPEDLFARVL
jgi:SAM-dependent methyltransferase